MAKVKAIEPKIGVKIDSKYKDLITSMAQMDKSGKWTIDLGNGPKEISNLSNDMLEAYSAKKVTLEENDKASQTLSEIYDNTVNAFRSALLPIAKPIMDKFTGMIQSMGTYFGNSSPFVQGLFGFGTILSPLLFNAAKWYINGYVLGKGFISYVSKQQMLSAGDGVGDGVISGGGGKYRKGFNAKYGKALMGAGGAGTLLGSASMFADQGSPTQKVLGIGGGALSGDALGDELGSFAGPYGTLIGAIIGAVGGGISGYMSTQSSDVNQDYISRPGQAPIPFSSKDTVVGFKPGGAIERAVLSNSDKPSISSNVIPSFSNSNNNNFTTNKEITFNCVVKGEINLTSDNSNVGSIDINQLMKNNEFKNTLAKMISESFRSNSNGGKLNPNILSS